MSSERKFKDRALPWVSYVALAVVVVAPAAASWHGLVDAGRKVFNLTDGWEYLVPLTLDGAALYCGTLAIRAILKCDSAFGVRLLTAIYALAAAGFQAYHAANVASAVFFAGASLSSVVLWDVTLRAVRRDQLRELGGIEKPLPKFRLLRWLVDPLTTFSAWRLAVIEQITEPNEALRIARVARTTPRSVTAERITEDPALTDSAAIEGGTDEQDRDTSEGRRDGLLEPAVLRGGGVLRVHGPDRSGSDGEHAAGQGPGGITGGSDLPEVGESVVTDLQKAHTEALRQDRDRDELRKFNKGQAVRWAFDRVGERDVPAALACLAERGVKVDRSYAYTIDWQPIKLPALAVVGRDQQ